MPADRTITFSPSPGNSTGSPTSAASPPKITPKKTTTKRSAAKHGSDAEPMPTTPPKKARKATASSPPGAGTDWSTVQGWSAEKKEAILNRLLTHAVADIGTKTLAEEAVRDAFKYSRPGNIRDRAVKGVKA